MVHQESDHTDADISVFDNMTLYVCCEKKKKKNYNVQRMDYITWLDYKVFFTC